jgi:peptidoglycan/xylan/chitin deacetylase (PgdA/CDA1 family)
MNSYENFLIEIKKCKEDSIPVNFWWRDDDLISNSIQFESICQISNQLSIPLLCSIIPKLVSKDLILDGANTELVSYCQHGWAHINHELEGQNKNEFGENRSSFEVRADIKQGSDALKKLLGEKLCAIFVPPWNQFDTSHLKVLEELEFQYLSSYGLQEEIQTQFNLTTINTHIDIIYWGKNGAHMRNIDEIFSTLTELLKQYQYNYKKYERPEVIGILSHHRVMKNGDFQSLIQLFNAIKSAVNIRFIPPYC